MKTKIYEKNDFKKYYSKNEEFKEAFIPHYIRNSINNVLISKKSFGNEENQNKNSNFSPSKFNNQNNKDYDCSYPTNNYTFKNEANKSEGKFYDLQNNEWNNRSAAYSYKNATNDFNKPNQNYFGFSKFLEKKNVYDRLSDLRDSIGKRTINSPYLVLSSHEDDKKEFYDKITTTSPNDYFVHSPRKIKSLLSINCRESHNNANDYGDLHLNKKGERSFSSSKTLFHTKPSDMNNLYNENLNLNSIGRSFLTRKDKISENSRFNINNNLKSREKLSNLNTTVEGDLNRSSTSFNLRAENNRVQLGLIVQQPSKVNILHKIEQYKDYLRYKGV